MNVDTLHSHTGRYVDESQMSTSWLCAYTDTEAPKHCSILPPQLPVNVEGHEGDYTLPLNMRKDKEKSVLEDDHNVPIISEALKPDNISLGDYTAPVNTSMLMSTETCTAEAMPVSVPDLDPVYTMPIKQVHHVKDKPDSDYLLPTSSSRPEPIGGHVPKSAVFEGSSLKNDAYRPESIMMASITEQDEMKD